MREHLTTDLHLNHQKLIDKGFRPDGYDKEILGDWAIQVVPGDVVYCLGDVAMGKEGEAHGRIKALPGYKILIRGNHDKKKDAWYLSHGWDEIHTELRMNRTVNGRHTRVILTHVPVADDNSWDLNVHGHFHNDSHRKMTEEMQAIYGNKHSLLALECVDYKMVGFQDFIEGKVVQVGLP